MYNYIVVIYLLVDWPLRLISQQFSEYHNISFTDRGTAGSRLLSTWMSAGTSLVAVSHAVCCSNKSVVKASSSIVSSLLNSGEAGDPSDGPSELPSKELDKCMVSEDVSLNTMLLQDKSLPEKETVLLPSEFVVSVGECIALTVLQYSGLQLWWLPKQCSVLYKMSSCKALAALGLSIFFFPLLLMMMAHQKAEGNHFR